MSILAQFALIFFLCILGELVSYSAPFIIPSSIIAMLLLFFLIFFKVVKISAIRKSTDFMMKHISFFFIPSSVSIMNYYSEISAYLLQFIIISIIATVITFIVTAYTVIGVIKLQARFSKAGSDV